MMISLNGTLRDRFRGALLGLSLSSTERTAAGSPVHDESSFVTDPLTQTMLMAVAPALLRYHDSWERRWAWIGSNVATATVQVLILGDVLEIVLRRGAIAPCTELSAPSPNLTLNTSSNTKPDGGWRSEINHLLSRLESCLDRYDLPVEQQQYYRETLAQVSHGLERTGELSISNKSVVLTTDAWVGGLLSALSQPESYELSVQGAALWGGIAPAIAGLVSGAMGGQAALPVLWQLWNSREDSVNLSEDRTSASRLTVIAIADDLFEQWSGSLLNAPDN